MDEHDDDLTVEVDEESETETAHFPETGDELESDENDEEADDDESFDSDPSEL